MLQDSLLWIAILGVLVGLGAAFAVPSTRPYAKKYWWGALIVVAVLLGMVLLRRAPGRSIDKAIDEGRDISDENLASLDKVVEYAQAGMAEADAELHVKTIAAEEDRKAYTAEVAAIKRVDSSMERRKALIKVVEDYS